MADKNIQMTQRNASNTGWDNLYPITKASNVQVTPISGLSGTDVQTVLQNLFRYANDGKTAVANAITAKGVSASPSETFASLAAKIGQISTGKKWASGTATSDSSSYVTVTGLTFKPKLIVLYNPSNPNYARMIYDEKASTTQHIEINVMSINTWNFATYGLYVNATGFKMRGVAASFAHDWIAIE